MNRLNRRQRHAVVITDAAPSFDDELSSRRRRYAVLMAVHIAGFALAGVLYYVAWWLGLVVMIATGALPWIAVVAANDSTPRAARPAHLTRPGATPASGLDPVPAQLADRPATTAGNRHLQGSDVLEAHPGGHRAGTEDA